MTTHYLDIDYSKMNFYEYSKDQKEGFKEHVNSNGIVSYRKDYDTGVFGLLESVGIRETDRGDKLQIRLKDGEEIYVCSLNLYDSKGQFDNRFIEPLIMVLPNMQKQQAYRVYPWMMEHETLKDKHGQPKKNYGFSVKVADLDSHTVSDRVDMKYLRKKKDEEYKEGVHQPELVFEKELGKLKPTAVSLDIRKKFFVKELESSLERLGYVKPEANTASTPNTAAAAKTTPPATPKSIPAGEPEEDYDDLPF